MDDIRISTITFDMDCRYINVQLGCTIHAINHIPNKKKLLCEILLYDYL